MIAVYSAPPWSQLNWPSLAGSDLPTIPRLGPLFEVLQGILVVVIQHCDVGVGLTQFLVEARDSLSYSCANMNYLDIDNHRHLTVV